MTQVACISDGDQIFESLKDIKLFFSAFPKLWKANISFVMCVRPSVSIEQLGSKWTDIHEIYVWVFFENLSRKYKIQLKSVKNNR